MREIYLDNAATTPMSPKVIDVITDEMKNDFGNASSTYELGRQARNVIDRARHQIAASINAKDNEGNTPLHCACEKGYSSTIDLLVQRGAKTDMKNNEGLTPADITS